MKITLFGILFGIIFLIFLDKLISSFSKNDPDTNRTSSLSDSHLVAPVVESEEVQINRKIDEHISNLKSISQNTIESVDVAQQKIDNCETVSTTIKNGMNLKVDSINKKAIALKKLLLNYQIHYFPLFRKVYAERAKNKLWEEDVYVDLNGSGNSVLNFTGGFFAANKNKADAYETIKDVMEKFRFKQIRFRWYKGQDEYTYYTVDSKNDTDL